MWNLNTPSEDLAGLRDALARHGGDLATARRLFPHAPLPWIDLSTGINPESYPVGTIDPDTWRRLPDRGDLAALERAARCCYGVPAGLGLVAAPGTQALIQVLPQIIPARQVAVLRFGYGEHPAVWRASGAEVSVIDDLERVGSADVVVVTTPNNPDGHVAAPGDLLRLAASLARHSGSLVIDEAFADVMPPEASLVPHLPSRGVLVLRSFGKFFGLAGLRLGFAMGDPSLCAALQNKLGPWAVAGPALAIGARALGDTRWQSAARGQLATTAHRLDAMLEGSGLSVIGGTNLYRLAAGNHAPIVFSRLGEAGILVRHFAHQPNWLRFGLPNDEAAWTRLTAALHL